MKSADLPHAIELALKPRRNTGPRMSTLAETPPKPHGDISLDEWRKRYARVHDSYRMWW